jgi:hypothetical protein
MSDRCRDCQYTQGRQCKCRDAGYRIDYGYLLWVIVAITLVMMSAAIAMELPFFN